MMKDSLIDYTLHLADNALVLGLFALLLAAEWVIRRGGGLP